MTSLDIIAISLLIITNVVTFILLVERRAGHGASKSQPPATAQPVVKLSDQKIAELEAATQAAFEAAVKQATDTFDQDLNSTSEKLSQLIVRLTTEVVETELTQYRQGLTDARAAALESLRQMQTAVTQQQSSLETDMQAEVEKRKAYLMERMDKRLGEIATNYIVESLGQGVDLGAQKAFLLASLERNKAELQKDIGGDKL